MATKQQVIDLHHSDPTLTSVQIAKILGCGPGYIVATFKRAGLKLPHSDRITGPRQLEREACAQLAEKMRSKKIAAAIRARSG